MSIKFNVREAHEYGSINTETELTPLKSDFADEAQVEIEDAPGPIAKAFNVKSIALLVGASAVLLMVGVTLLSRTTTSTAEAKVDSPILSGAWSSKADPFSNVNPIDVGIQAIDRPVESKPGAILANLVGPLGLAAPSTPLPTNSWYQNLILGDTTTSEDNKVFQIPYLIDAAGLIPGVRTHSTHLLANDRMVMMNHEPQNGLTLGARETFLPQHLVHKHDQGSPAVISKLAIELEWVSNSTKGEKGPMMQSPIVRGSPYTSMIYSHSTPRIFAERAMTLSTHSTVEVDGEGWTGKGGLKCATQDGVFGEAVLVQKEMRVSFDQSDMTWLIFVSEPTAFECSSVVRDHSLDPPQAVGIPQLADPDHADHFDLRAVKPMHKGMVRIAMGNNCTTGQNAQYCNGGPRPQVEYESLLRKHAEVYATAQADIEFSFPISSEEEEELQLIFNWRPATMSNLGSEGDVVPAYDGKNMAGVELMMFALPHHQERLRPRIGSSNVVLKPGCHTAIHGYTCPALGGSWTLLEHLHRTEFYAPRAPRAEMLPAIQAALKKDIKYSPPPNYMAGMGDTYFSGKMLAKLARILVVAEEVGGVDEKDLAEALDTLRRGVEVWFDPNAGSPFLYDRAWGGMVMCGCDYQWDEEKKKHFCANKFPDCPALTDAGQNFGAGFYNDHHYHFGYHIYAAAVVARMDRAWGRKYHQRVLLLVRDIVNPSDADEYFPTWRHKDWYLGFSWASGIVTLGGRPYPNGRNEESSSEAIAAYEAVALYGDAMAGVFQGTSSAEDRQALETSRRIRDMGRLLMATEIRSTRMYWHVQAPGTEGVMRIYPEDYKPKVVGMMWAVLAQLQTWFGNEAWKSYGIQLMPITPASELRDAGSWVPEMLPELANSCLPDPTCKKSGWAVVVYAMMATAGKWRGAWGGLMGLEASFFEDAGGNGHSLSNSLWWVATRPVVYAFNGEEEEEGDDGKQGEM